MPERKTEFERKTGVEYKTGIERKAGVERKTCRDMSEVRAAIDAIDQEIVALIADRLHFIEEAARLKPDRGKVRDDIRVADVLVRVRATARAKGIDPDLVSNVYRELIERSIAHEFAVFDALRDAKTAI